MQTRLLLAAAAGLMVAAAPATAAGDKDDPSKIICKKSEQNGSLIPKRTCRTRAEWDKLRDDAQGALANYQGAGWLGREGGTAPTGNNALTGAPNDNGAPF